MSTLEEWYSQDNTWVLGTNRPDATMSLTYLALTAQVWNLGLYCERLTTICLSHGVFLKCVSCICKLYSTTSYFPLVHIITNLKSCLDVGPWPRIQSLIPGRSKGFFSTDSWIPHGILFSGCWGLFPQGNFSDLRMSEISRSMVSLFWREIKQFLISCVPASLQHWSFDHI